MKKNFYRHFVYSSMLFACCVALPSYSFASQNSSNSNQNPNKKDVVFAQLSSSQTQIPGISTQVVALENIEELAGLKLASTNKKIIVTEPGVYFISANGRLGTQSINMIGTVQLFIRKNEIAIPSTYASFSPQNKQEFVSTVSQTVVSLETGDAISLGISSNAPNLGLLSSTVAPDTIVPSITFTMYKISN